MKQETRSLTLVRLEVGELPKGGLNEVPHEARDPRELSAVEGGLNEVPLEACDP